MEGGLAALDPHKAVLPIIALLGLIPVLLQYRSQSKWFVVGYSLLIVATLATNLENLALGTVLNYTEHVIGLMGSGLAFLTAAYVRRQRILADADERRGSVSGNSGQESQPTAEV